MLESPTGVQAAEVGHLRIAIVEDDADMANLFADIFGQQGTVARVSGITSLTALAESAPDVIVLGLNCSGGLPPWQLVELIRQHRTLHAVPIVVTMLDVAAAMREGQLSTHRGVHAVEMPCDVELLQGIVGRVQPCSEPTATRSVAMRAMPGLGRLPDVCPHGYPMASVESCRVCCPVGAELTMARHEERTPQATR